MAKSIKINFVYNLINTISGFLFPLITFPYASRILMAEGLGEVNFFNSIINYVILLTNLGIPLYGIREVARVRDSREELTKTTFEILSLNLLLNLIGYCIIAILCLSVQELQHNLPLFMLLSSSIVLTTLGCNWFYSGIEDFKFIAIRGVGVRIFGLLILFTLVRTKDDLFYYGLYLVLTSVGSNVINLLFLKKHLNSIRSLKIATFNIKKHIKPACSIFVLNLITSIYLNLDKVMLGFMQDSTAVGYYTAATQISQILLAVVSILGGVMLPRASNLVKNGQLDEFFRLSEKSYHFILLISLPIIVGTIVLAPALIHVFCGRSYEPSIGTLRIITPIVLAIGVSNLVGLQVFYPLGKTKLVTMSTCVGALVNLTLNFVLIPILSHNGAAIATLFAEFSVTITQIMMARKIVPYQFANKVLLRYAFVAIIMGTICYFISMIVTILPLQLFIIPIVGSLVYGTVLFFRKDSLAREIVNTFINKIKNK